MRVRVRRARGLAGAGLSALPSWAADVALADTVSVDEESTDAVVLVALTCLSVCLTGEGLAAVESVFEDASACAESTCEVSARARSTCAALACEGPFFSVPPCEASALTSVGASFALERERVLVR